MTVDEIKRVVSGFALTAKLASDAGFAVVEIHAAHGYALAQFPPEKMDRRTNDTVDYPRVICACSCSIKEVGEDFNTVGWKIAVLQRAWS